MKGRRQVVVLTRANDEHSAAVCAAIRSIEYPVTLIFGADLPTEASHSIFLENNSEPRVFSGDAEWNCDTQETTVWNRRHSQPHLPEGWCDDRDRFFAEMQLEHMLRCSVELIGLDAFWANSPCAVVRANCKALQLAIAKRAGFAIPRSLFSNSPAEIKRFLANDPLREQIYKPFSQARWAADDTVRVVPTVKVSIDQLPSDRALRIAPGIFQDRVEKAYEIRCYVLGKSCFAVKIFSQENARGMVDWREIPLLELKIEPIELPLFVKSKVFEVMDALSLVTGSIDLIYSTDGEYVFLEVNESGQFLWIEQLLPDDMPLLDATLSFLVQPSQDFDWRCCQRFGVSVKDKEVDLRWIVRIRVQ